MQVFVFPGQGSQKRGMGQGLFSEVREYLAVESQVDQIVGYSMRRLCLEDRDNRLKETQFTQPSLYVVNALHYYAALARGERPQYVAGHSLGEYNALLAAGAFDFLTGLKLVCKRGELMSQVRGGGMAAVIGLDGAAVSYVLSSSGFSGTDVANYNSPSQTVISGPLDEIERAGPLFEKQGARMYMPLPVSAAFHSRYMADAARAFGKFLEPFTFNPLKVPLVANVTGEVCPAGTQSDTIKSLLVRQITGSVRWTQSIRGLLQRGGATFREMGPGNVLGRLIQQIQSDSESLAPQRLVPGASVA